MWLAQYTFNAKQMTVDTSIKTNTTIYIVVWVHENRYWITQMSNAKHNITFSKISQQHVLDGIIRSGKTIDIREVDENQHSESRNEGEVHLNQLVGQSFTCTQLHLPCLVWTRWTLFRVELVDLETECVCLFIQCMSVHGTLEFECVVCEKWCGQLEWSGALLCDCVWVELSWVELTVVD